MTTFATYQVDVAPPWLQAPTGAAFLGALGDQKDALATELREAVYLRVVDDPQGRRCPDDALPRHGLDRVLPQLPGETAAAHRARLVAAWTTWRRAGTYDGLAATVALLGHAGATILRARDWSPDTRPDLWARWWVLVPTTGHGYGPEDPWGTGTWGDGGTWGSDATPDDVARTIQALRGVTNARDVGRIRFALGADDYWGPFTPWASGDWGDTTYIEWRIQ